MNLGFSARKFGPFFVGFLALSIACREKADPVREVLDRMVHAAEARDAPGVVKNLTADFRDAAGGDTAEASATLRRYFAAYEAVRLRVEDLTIERAPEAARARLRVAFSGRPRKFGGLDRFLPSASTYSLDMRLVPEGDHWKVAWASWQEEGNR
jgi:hypothetical protein